MNIIDTLSATYCKHYIDTRQAQAKKTVKCKCKDCKKISKYNYCKFKKRSFSYEEQQQERLCSRFIGRTVTNEK